MLTGDAEQYQLDYMIKGYGTERCRNTPAAHALTLCTPLYSLPPQVWSIARTTADYRAAGRVSSAACIDSNARL